VGRAALEYLGVDRYLARERFEKQQGEGWR
jgi:hypothetical protein